MRLLAPEMVVTATAEVIRGASTSVAVEATVAATVEVISAKQE